MNYGIWMPSAAILCYKCYAQLCRAEENEPRPPRTQPYKDTAYGTCRCNLCDDETTTLEDVAALRRIDRALRSIGVPSGMQQTGGGCAALFIPLEHRFFVASALDGPLLVSEWFKEDDFHEEHDLMIGYVEFPITEDKAVVHHILSNIPQERLPEPTNKEEPTMPTVETETSLTARLSAATAKTEDLEMIYREITEDAIDTMLAGIQTIFDVEGDYAAQHFSGTEGENLVACVLDYVRDQHVCIIRDREVDLLAEISELEQRTAILKSALKHTRKRANAALKVSSIPE
jgi:hypothetical protein